MERILYDARFALRTLRKQPAFTLTVVATLGLAIGASTAIFSIVEATILRPLPFQTPDRIVLLEGVAGPQQAVRGASYAEALDWARLNRTFENVAIYDETSLNLRTDNGAERIEAEMVSAPYFRMLGAKTQLGRTFTAEEDAVPNAYPVVTISDKLWRNQFGGDPRVVGRTLTLNDRSFAVVGVMQPNFSGLSFDTDVWFPAAMVQANGGPADLTARGTRWLGAVGRMKAGVTFEQAQSDANRVGAQLAKEYPESNADRGIKLFTLRQSYLGSTQNLLISVFAAVSLLLLIACANVAGLQLVRATARRREIALRLAIGSNRSRLVQQLVVEGLVLALLGAAAGWLAAYWGLQALLLLAPEGMLPNYAAPSLNFATFAFTLMVAVICGVVFGLVPALRSSRVDLVDSLKEGARGSAAGYASRRFNSQQLLVIGETAVAFLLLIGAGLFVRSLQRQLSISTGFDARGVLRARVVLPQEKTPALRLQFAEQLHDKLASTPSVRGVAVASDMPLSGGSSAAFLHMPETRQHVRFYRHSIAPDFFAALGIHLVEGRAFGAGDRDDSPPVVIINESAARRFWSGESALGKRFRLGDEKGPEVTIVGVVSDVRYRNLTSVLASTEPDVFFPLAQRPPGSLQIGVRSSLTTTELTTAMRAAVSALDPAVPLFGVRPLENVVAAQTAGARFASSVLSVFALAALVLTAVGLYGVLSFLVGLRRREIGIRIALGATRSAVLREVVGYGLKLIAIGVTVGVVAATGATRWVASQLYGVGAHDPGVFVVVPVLLLAITALATWIPARRAAAVDPQIALRQE